MNLNTKELQDVCKTVLLAVDNTAGVLEIKAENNVLSINVGNSGFYVSKKFNLEITEPFRAVVDAKLFLSLVSEMTAENIDLTIDGNTLKIRANKSNYKLAMVYEDEKMMDLPEITIVNKTVEMPISLDILKSILNVNSKEVQKVKRVGTNAIFQNYLLTETGCFTRSNGACINSFTLEKPIKVLLTDKLVKLFKLFKSDVDFSLGYDQISGGKVQAKVIFKTDDTYLAGILNCEDEVLNQLVGPFMATQQYVKENYANKLVLSSSILNAAVSRIISYSKHTSVNDNPLLLMASCKILGNDFTITDKFGNEEVINIENGSVASEYDMKLNLIDLKLVLDSCQDEYITLNCGNTRSVIITRNNIYNLIPEGKRD